ncbi:SanA/YdcF family protein [Cesiribacter andamanensis]|uniref:Vancomycin high temperature exclusion protein n=1 Tax=Cesiribacter andamanensis AMV16 TaxID=1279009 RepID=M7NK99_9BACT|nr:ElyC/SanA/YdcF family protein [Cesiribacter andamanensis]EMR02200.1 vancomycin high temperature exclusion protein [Cesiribacter andamanensis AMV16]
MIKDLIKIVLTSAFAVLLLLIACNIWVILSTNKHVYSELRDVPSSKVALVLGTSRRFADGRPNTYFENRIDAAARLYKEGKIKHLILSGDNRTQYYNEPRDMQNALVKRGIPEEAITLDYAGLRTLDSMARSKLIFGQEELIVVTQKFHSYRAVFIGEYYDINTVAYAADELPLRESINILFREFLARPMAVLDLYVLRKAPRHLGEREPIGV